MVQLCAQCGKETENPKFCSQTCSATFNNAIRYSGLDKYVGVCKKCEGPCKKGRKLCNDCFTIRGLNGGEDMTLGEAKYKKGSQSNASTLIRFRARVMGIDTLGWKCCEKCGYDKHIEIAHKKAISEFTDDTLISVINSADNLMALCPNCHWEYDHPNCSIQSPRLRWKKRTRKCLYCKELIREEHTTCKTCSNKFTKFTTNWPKLETLLEMVDKTNLTQVGKQLGVSANAVKKHIKKEQEKLIIINNTNEVY